MLDDSIGLDVQVPVHPRGTDRSYGEGLPTTTTTVLGRLSIIQANQQGLTRLVGGELPVYLQWMHPKSLVSEFLGCWGNWAPTGLWVSRVFQSEGKESKRRSSSQKTQQPARVMPLIMPSHCPAETCWPHVQGDHLPARP